jgi:hypothetical protein
MLVVVPPNSRFTLNEMVESARRNGYSLKPRLVTDWVSKGLLDRPERVGLGRGRGSIATWPESQRQLLLTLLGQRPRAATAFDALLNVPVFVWLYFGDDWIPLRQIRRALSYWTKSLTGAPWHLAVGRATEDVQKIAHPRASHQDRKKLIEALARMRTRPLSTLADGLPELFHRVMDPESTGRPRGPAGAPVDPGAEMDLLRWRQIALTRLKVEDGTGGVPDSAFHWGRWVLLKGLSAYSMNQPLFALNAELGTMFQQLDWNLLAANACVDLVTVIGMRLTMAADSAPKDPLLDPRTWDAHGLTSRIADTQITGAGVNISLHIRPGPTAKRPRAAERHRPGRADRST